MLVLLGSRQGLEKVMKQFPGLEIFVGGIDEIVRLHFYLFYVPSSYRLPLEFLLTFFFRLITP